MKNIFSFGEKVDGYNTLVLNEREVRAGAGILFLFALPIFLVSCLSMDFYTTKIFITLFMIDFFIRVFINPKFAPSLILGRFFVSNQKPEYVGAPQKRFAWGLGFFMSLLMFFLMVVFNLFLFLNVILCFLCLILLFFESSFGICLGCKMYNLINRQKAENCPGGVCEVNKKEEIQKISYIQILILIISIIFIFFITNLTIFGKEISNLEYEYKNIIKEEESTCIIPDFLKGNIIPCGK